MVWERNITAQGLWREAYLKRQKRKGRDTRGRSRLRWRGNCPLYQLHHMGRQALPFGQHSRDDPVDESTGEPILRM